MKINCEITEHYFIAKALATKSAVDKPCMIKCRECPLGKEKSAIASCIELEINYPETAIKLMREWCDIHLQTLDVPEPYHQGKECSQTINYFKGKARMVGALEEYECTVHCEDCLLGWYKNHHKLECEHFEMMYPKEAIAVVQKWVDEH